MQLPQVAVHASVHETVAAAVDNVRGFSVEKHGLAPDVVLEDLSQGACVYMMPAFVEYAIAEVLKNAVQAMVAQYGAWDLDEAPPIQVTVSADQADSDADEPLRGPELWSPPSSKSSRRRIKEHADADSDGELLTGELTEAREMPVWFLQGIF